jgi:RNA polymerase sigma factor (sigma-70 family)
MISDRESHTRLSPLTANRWTMDAWWKPPSMAMKRHLLVSFVGIRRGPINLCYEFCVTARTHWTLCRRRSSFIHLHSFEGKAKFSTWLIRIAVNSALMELRRRNRRLNVQLGGPSDDEHPFRCLEPADHRVDIHAAFEPAELKCLLAEAVCRLKPVLREMLELQLRFDYSQQELASLAMISVPAVKSRIFRARKALRLSLVEQHGPVQRSKLRTSESTVAQ